jgi:AraC-like DNA-binding protein
MTHQAAGQGRSDPGDSERSADVYKPVASLAVLNIIDYRFGTTWDATRPDCVVRFPGAALLIQRRGQLYEHFVPGQRTPLPRIALLGPTYHAHIWETAPRTWFTLVNLAPGAARYLLGIDPRDVREEIEPLSGHVLADMLSDPGLEPARLLDRRLSRMVRERSDQDWHTRRAFKTILSLKKAQFGPQVRDYADNFGMTPRTLQRIVNSAIGLTSKQVLVIQRIRRLISLTEKGWNGSIAELAQEGGFFDQSHLHYDLARVGVARVSQLVEGNHIITEI